MNRTPPAPSRFASHWSLDPSVVFLNHGSFGATPKAVAAYQNALRARMDAEPVRFFVEDLRGLMDTARAEAAALLRCQAAEIALIANATIGVNTVMHNVALRGLLKPGDEILCNDHEYPACLNTMRFYAQRAGASVVVAELPWPLPFGGQGARAAAEQAVAEAILARVTPRTRLVLLSHVTSSSGLILPVETITRELAPRGIEVLIDGAHAPGMLPKLDLSELARLGVTYYTANFHKWVCSPKGSAVLWVHPNRREGFRPLALSNQAEVGVAGRAQFLTEFDFLGTQDPTAMLSVGEAIRVMSAMLPGGFASVAAQNHDLTIQGRNTVLKALGTEPCAPDDMLGSLASMLLPPRTARHAERLMRRPTRFHDALQDRLVDHHRVQVPIWSVKGRTWPSVNGEPGGPMRLIRISPQLYNSIEQYEFLAEVLREEMAGEAAF